MVSDIPISEQTSEQSERSKWGCESSKGEHFGANKWVNEWPLLNEAVVLISDHSALSRRRHIFHLGTEQILLSANPRKREGQPLNNENL